ncbi:MAG: Lysine/arginine racemase [Anaerolineales bacterium]|nr:Lysine/arginine racemase [Anaerolineales bacterium]
MRLFSWTEFRGSSNINYGRTYTTQRDTSVALVPFGYSNGYPRALSNRGQVLIGGRWVPIVGRVCMDPFMVDVSDVPDVGEGDEVVNNVELVSHT